MSGSAGRELASPLPRWFIPVVIAALVIGAGGLVPAFLNVTPDSFANHNGDENTGSENVHLTSMLGRLAAGTIFVLALCALGIPLLKRQSTQPATKTASSDLQVVATLPLVGKCRVSLIRSGDWYLLAGLDAAGVKALVAVGPPEAAPSVDEWTAPRELRASATIEPRRVVTV